ncbi:hypothetical protein C4577_05845 [Candidatus Parcubacteria bacterium]|nr:MAG: hypothetical protein C4577_05845 [Candidatus Parcubacteria bacterium]
MNGRKELIISAKVAVSITNFRIHLFFLIKSMVVWLVYKIIVFRLRGFFICLNPCLPTGRLNGLL